MIRSEPLVRGARRRRRLTNRPTAGDIVRKQGSGAQPVCVRVCVCVCNKDLQVCTIYYAHIKGSLEGPTGYNPPAPHPHLPSQTPWDHVIRRLCSESLSGWKSQTRRNEKNVARNVRKELQSTNCAGTPECTTLKSFCLLRL